MPNPNDLVFVDANIPMYAAGAPHALKGPCVAILAAIARGGMAAVTDAEVIQELLHRYTALGDRGRSVELARLFARVVPDVLAVGRSEMLSAIALHERHSRLTARDSVHLAVMQRHGIVRLLSADRHFDAVPGIVRIDPAAWAA